MRSCQQIIILFLNEDEISGLFLLPSALIHVCPSQQSLLLLAAKSLLADVLLVGCGVWLGCWK